MAYIVKDDLVENTRDGLIDEWTESDDTKLDTPIRQAEAQISKYLEHKYDMAIEFAKTTTDRNADIVRIGVDITLFYLGRKINRKQMPEHMIEAFNIAIKDLEKYQKEVTTLSIDKLDTEGSDGQNIITGTIPNTKYTY